MTIAKQMRVFTLQDYTGRRSKHLAINFEAAIQAHLVHHGLLSLSGSIVQIDLEKLKDIKDKSLVYWEVSCCLAGASEDDNDNSRRSQ